MIPVRSIRTVLFGMTLVLAAATAATAQAPEAEQALYRAMFAGPTSFGLTPLDEGGLDNELGWRAAAALEAFDPTFDFADLRHHLAAFQEARGLPATGYVDRATLMALLDQPLDMTRYASPLDFGGGETRWFGRWALTAEPGRPCWLFTTATFLSGRLTEIQFDGTSRFSEADIVLSAVPPADTWPMLDFGDPAWFADPQAVELRGGDRRHAMGLFEGLLWPRGGLGATAGLEDESALSAFRRAYETLLAVTRGKTFDLVGESALGGPLRLTFATEGFDEAMAAFARACPDAMNF